MAPEPKNTEEQEVASVERGEGGSENRFSQDDDDTAGRSWHGMTSDYEMDEVGRFGSDEDADEDEARDRPGRIERA